MKKLVIMIFALLFSLGWLGAQDVENEVVQEMRKKFYQEELQFTSSEETAFWPLYDEFKEDEAALKQKYANKVRFELMSDAQAEAFIRKSFEHEESQIALKRTYFDKLMKVLPVRKIAMLNRTERKFKRQMLTKIKDRRKNKKKKKNRKF